MPAQSARIVRAGAHVVDVAAHHRTALRRFTERWATLLDIAEGAGVGTETITPVVDRLVGLGTLERRDDRYRVTLLGRLDLLAPTVRQAFEAFRYADALGESRLHPLRSVAVMLQLAAEGWVRRSRGRATITEAGRRALALLDRIDGGAAREGAA